MKRKRGGPDKKRLMEVDENLRRKASGKRCSKHRRSVTLGVIWADGRASAFFCDRDCFLDWEESQGKWACVVRVIPVNREVK